MITTVADHLHDAAIGPRQFQAHRHAAAEAEPAAGETDIGLRPGAGDVLLQDGCVADRLVDDDVVLRELCVQRREYKRRTERAGNPFVCARSGATFCGSVPRALPACNAVRDTAAIRL